MPFIPRNIARTMFSGALLIATLAVGTSCGWKPGGKTSELREPPAATQNLPKVSFQVADPVPVDPDLISVAEPVLRKLIETGSLPEHYRSKAQMLDLCPMDQRKLIDDGKLFPKWRTLISGCPAGGDSFENRKQDGYDRLPCLPGIQYKEADIGKGMGMGDIKPVPRGSQRIVWDNQTPRNYYVTDTHYKTWYTVQLTDGRITLQRYIPAPPPPPPPTSPALCAMARRVDATIKASSKITLKCVGPATNPSCSTQNAQMGFFMLAEPIANDLKPGVGRAGDRKAIYFTNESGITLVGQDAFAVWQEAPGSAKAYTCLVVGKTADAFTLLPGAGPILADVFDTAWKIGDEIDKCVTAPRKSSKRIELDQPLGDPFGKSYNGICGQSPTACNKVDSWRGPNRRFNSCVACCTGQGDFKPFGSVSQNDLLTKPQFCGGNKEAWCGWTRACYWNCRDVAGATPEIGKSADTWADGDFGQCPSEHDARFPPEVIDDSGQGDFSGDTGTGGEIDGDIGSNAAATCTCQTWRYAPELHPEPLHSKRVCHLYATNRSGLQVSAFEYEVAESDCTSSCQGLATARQIQCQKGLETDYMGRWP